MESKSALVRSQCRIELHTVSTVDLYFALVVFPHNTELDDPLGDGSDLEGGLVFRVLLKQGGVFEG